MSRVSRVLAFCFAMLLCTWVQLAAAVKAVDAPAPFRVYQVDADAEHIGVFLNDRHGQRLGSFNRLRQHVADSGGRLEFATNGGIYQQGGAPLGLLVVEGRQLHRLNRRTKAHGNFYLQPNGVFLIGEHGPRIITTEDYPPADTKWVKQATQSGPLLVINGKRNGQLPVGASLVRNGVGVRGSSVFFVVADAGVTFHEFADFFVRVLHCTDALYLDGNISGAWYAGTAGVGSVSGSTFGPMIGVTSAVEE